MKYESRMKFNMTLHKTAIDEPPGKETLLFYYDPVEAALGNSLNDEISINI